MKACPYTLRTVFGPNIFDMLLQDLYSAHLHTTGRSFYPPPSRTYCMACCFQGTCLSGVRGSPIWETVSPSPATHTLDAHPTNKQKQQEIGDEPLKTPSYPMQLHKRKKASTGNWVHKPTHSLFKCKMHWHKLPQRSCTT